MAKRIKVKGNPRGLSKLSRVTDYQWQKSVGDDSPMETWPPEVLRAIAKAKGGSTRPSSTRKKLVKEGNRKFIGPRQFKGELAENRNVGMTSKDVSRLEATNLMDQEVLDTGDPELLAKYVRAIKNYRKAASRRRRGSTRPEYGRGTIGSKKLRDLLMNLERRNLGGGQKFDAQD